MLPGAGTAGTPQLESPTFFLPGLPTWLQLAAGVFLPRRCEGRGRGRGMERREERETGPWLYLARMPGAKRRRRVETSGLWQPHPGLWNVGLGNAGLQGCLAAGQASWGRWANTWHMG